jgi:hypothetical protein
MVESRTELGRRAKPSRPSRMRRCRSPRGTGDPPWGRLLPSARLMPVRLCRQAEDEAMNLKASKTRQRRSRDDTSMTARRPASPTMRIR